jgi:hypothetical protein
LITRFIHYYYHYYYYRIPLIGWWVCLSCKGHTKPHQPKMHRQQKPHSRTAAGNNISPPSTKRPPFHRQTTFPAFSTAAPANPNPNPSHYPPAKKGGKSLNHRKSASAHTISHHHNNHHHSHGHKSHQSLSKLLGAGSGPASLPVSKADDEMATSFLQYWYVPCPCPLSVDV